MSHVVVRSMIRVGAILLAAGTVAVALLVLDPDRHLLPEAAAAPLVGLALVAVPVGAVLCVVGAALDFRTARGQR